MNESTETSSELQQHIGVKLINALPMTRLEYNQFRGWDLPEDEDGSDAGFLVEYLDGGKPNTEAYAGYVSWSPEEVFHNAYRCTDGLSFGLAVEAMKKGHLISRAGWNGKNMFVFKQIPAEIGLDIIPNMQSVPQAMKDKMVEAQTTLKYTNQMCIVTEEGRVDSWVASSSDTFADDWCIVERN